MNKIRF